MRLIHKFPEHFNSNDILTYRVLCDFSYRGILNPTYAELESQSRLSQSVLSNSIKVLMKAGMVMANGREKFVPDFLDSEHLIEMTPVPDMTVRVTALQELYAQGTRWFTAMTKIHPPVMVEDSDWAAFQKRWQEPIKGIYGQIPGAYVDGSYVFDDKQRAVLFRVMRSTLSYLVSKELDYTVPQSLEKTARNILSAQRDHIVKFMNNQGAVAEMLAEVEQAIKEVKDV